MSVKPTYEELEQRVRELEAAKAEWEKTEAELRENRNKYRTLFEAANDAFLVACAETGVIRDANQKAEQLTGKPKDEIIGMHFTELHPPEQRSAAIRNFEKDAKLKGEDRYTDFVVQHADGRNTPVQISPSLIQIQGNPCVLGIFREISEQRKAEDALKKSETRHRAIFKQAAVGISVVSAQGNVLEANETMCDMLGYTHEELTKLTIADINWPEDLQRQQSLIQEVLEGKRDQFQIEKRYMHKNGQLIWVYHSSNVVRNDNGAIEYAIGASVNITARKQAEENLLKSEGRLRTVLESMQDEVYVHDFTGRFLMVNKAACRKTGYRRDQLLRMSVEDIVRQRRFLEISRQSWLKITTQCPIHFESAHTRKDGSAYPVQIRMNPIMMPDGPAILILALDITERKRAAEALEASEKKHRLVVNTMQEGIWWINAENVTTYVNPQMATMLGFTPDEMIGKALFEFMDEARKQSCVQYLDRRRRGIAEKHDFEFLKKDGDTLHTLLGAVPIFDDEGFYQGALASVTDITERKRTEQALMESEARFRALFEQAAAGIAAVNPDGRIVDANQALCDMLGYTSQELTQLSVFDITHPPDMEMERPKVRKILCEEQNTLEIEKRYHHKDGRLVWVRLCLNAVRDKNGELKYVIGVVVNITERKRTEQALQKSLEEKEVLLREIHHRVKNNMQVIVALLRMHARRSGDAHFTGVFNDCRGRIEAMSLIHEALYQSDDLAHIDFKAYLRNLCRNLALAHDAGARGVELTVNASDVALDMDRGIAVGMIIAELVSNTFKHAFPSDGGGVVTVGMTRLDAETVELIVADNGKGLPPDFDVSKSRSLGMRLVWGAVTRELGGALEVSNEGGAKFIIRFRNDSKHHSAR